MMPFMSFTTGGLSTVKPSAAKQSKITILKNHTNSKEQIKFKFLTCQI